nr:hypothetical protein [Streptomyces sp. SID8382]
MIREPHRRRCNAITVGGAGAAHLIGGCAPLRRPGRSTPAMRPASRRNRSYGRRIPPRRYSRRGGRAGRGRSRRAGPGPPAPRWATRPLRGSAESHRPAGVRSTGPRPGALRWRGCPPGRAGAVRADSAG